MSVRFFNCTVVGRIWIIYAACKNCNKGEIVTDLPLTALALVLQKLSFTTSFQNNRGGQKVDAPENVVIFHQMGDKCTTHNLKVNTMKIVIIINVSTTS